MLRSSIGIVLRTGQRRSAPVLGRQQLKLNRRCFSAGVGDDKPKPPSTSSSELAPIGDGDNLPASLIDFQVSSKIEGEESHVAFVDLRPGETLRAEAGAMLFMTEGIVMDTTLSGASSAFSRMMTGQNMFLTDFRYEGKEGSATVGLGTDFPSKIMRFSLEEFEGSSLICQRGAFLASNPTVNIEMEFTKSLKAGFFGGQGFVLQRLTGQGDVLIKGGGTIVCKELEEGQKLRVTSGSIVAFEPTVAYDVQMMPGVKNVMFGGEGLFVTELRGPGRIWLQGMPADRMIAEIARRVPSGGPGIGIPIGMGGGGADAGAAGAEASEGGAVAEGGGEEMVAASDAAIEADRQATVASSGGMSSNDVDADSQSALFGDAVSADNQDSNTPTGETATDSSFGDDASWASSSEEPSFMDSQEDSFSTGDSDEMTFDDSGFDEDTTSLEGLDDAASEAAEAGKGWLSTLWDFITDE